MSNINNDLDKMLQEDDTPPASPAQIDGQQIDSTQGRPIEQQSDEEAEFNSLSGSSQERVRELVRRAREAEEKLGQQTYIPPAPNTLAPDQKQAIDTLAGFGIATDDKVDRKVSEAINAVRWEQEQTRLAQKYSGSNGLPQYVREDMEDYIRTHPQYMSTPPEDVFKLRFIDEFASAGQATKPRTSSLRPTRAQANTSSITPDNVEEMVKSHDQDWYNEHQDEINAAVQNHTRQFDNQGNRV